MKMKNVFMLLLGAMLVLSMAGGVSAATANPQPTNITQADFTPGQPDPTRTTIVTLNLGQSFEVELPASFSLTDETGDDVYTGLAFVNATVNRLESGRTLTVTVSSTDPSNQDKVWNLKNDAGDKLEYVIGLGDAGNSVNLDEPNNLLTSGATIIPNLGVGGTASKALHFKLTSSVNEAKTGEYTDTLTFTVAVV